MKLIELLFSLLIYFCFSVRSTNLAEEGRSNRQWQRAVLRTGCDATPRKRDKHANFFFLRVVLRGQCKRVKREAHRASLFTLLIYFFSFFFVFQVACPTPERMDAATENPSVLRCARARCTTRGRGKLSELLSSLFLFFSYLFILVIQVARPTPDRKDAGTGNHSVLRCAPARCTTRGREKLS